MLKMEPVAETMPVEPPKDVNPANLGVVMFGTSRPGLDQRAIARRLGAHFNLTRTVFNWNPALPRIPNMVMVTDVALRSDVEKLIYSIDTAWLLTMNSLSARPAAQMGDVANGANPPAFDPVSRPEHYAQGGIECIDAIEAQLSREEFIGFLRGQVAKYNWRLRLKAGAQDVRKGMWYAERLAKLLEAAP